MEILHFALAGIATSSAIIGMAMPLFSVKPEAQVRIQSMLLQSIAFSLLAMVIK